MNVIFFLLLLLAPRAKVLERATLYYGRVLMLEESEGSLRICIYTLS